MLSRRAKFRCSSFPFFPPSHCITDEIEDRLICSDLIARGIDLPQVSHVISYDIPSDMRKYVHRVGRTARAGKSGDAWSLVEDQEVRLTFSASSCLVGTGADVDCVR